MALLNKHGKPTTVNWNGYQPKDEVIYGFNIIKQSLKPINEEDKEYLNNKNKIDGYNVDELIDKLIKIANEDVKPNFTYRIVPLIRFNTLKKWQEFHDSILGEFFWTLADKLTNNAEYDEWLSQITDDMYTKIHEYYLSIGWEFKVRIYEDEKVIEFISYEIVPSEVNMNFMDIGEIVEDSHADVDVVD